MKEKLKQAISFPMTTYLFVFLMGLGWYFVLVVDGGSIGEIFTEKNGHFALKFLRRLVGVGLEDPAWTQAYIWKDTLVATLDTLKMSLLSILLTGVMALVSVPLGTRSIAFGDLTLTTSPLGRFAYYMTQALYTLGRAIPELIWAMMIIFVFKPGLVAGALALAIHNFGILGKLWTETIDDMATGPVHGLALTGASHWQLLVFAVLPAVVGKWVSYMVYRWEIILRTTIVVGFVGAGGLGQDFRTAMSFLHYDRVLVILLTYLSLVYLADRLSDGLRKRLGEP